LTRELARESVALIGIPKTEKIELKHKADGSKDEVKHMSEGSMSDFE